MEELSLTVDCGLRPVRASPLQFLQQPYAPVSDAKAVLCFSRLAPYFGIGSHTLHASCLKSEERGFARASSCRHRAAGREILVDPGGWHSSVTSDHIAPSVFSAR